MQSQAIDTIATLCFDSLFGIAHKSIQTRYT